LRHLDHLPDSLRGSSRQKQLLRLDFLQGTQTGG
jgi:hypothetical protein